MVYVYFIIAENRQNCCPKIDFLTKITYWAKFDLIFINEKIGFLLLFVCLFFEWLSRLLKTRKYSIFIFHLFGMMQQRFLGPKARLCDFLKKMVNLTPDLCKYSDSTNVFLSKNVYFYIVNMNNLEDPPDIANYKILPLRIYAVLKPKRC